MKHTTLAALFAALALPAFAEVTTGWQSPLDGGTYTWSDTANWVDGEINGVFSDGLVGSGKTYPTIVFTADATLTNGLSLLYSNSEQNLTFRGDGGDRTLTLGGSVSMNLHSSNKGSVKFGSTTAGQGLSLHFEGAPVFDVGYGPWMELFQPVSGNGETLVTGERGIATFLALHGDAAAFPGAVSVAPNKGLYFNSTDKNAQGAIRASSVRLDRADILVQGNSGAASTDTISDNLVLGGGGLSQFAHYYNSGFKNHTLRVGSLVAEPGAVLDIHSPSLVLGATEFESGNNFVVDAGVATVGTGPEGTVFAPVVPWARASVGNSKNWATADNLFGYLVSYDATRGFRILDRATEQEAYGAGYVGPVTNQNANVFVSVANEVVEFTGTNVVNSLQFTTSAKAGTLRAYDGTLTVSSGAIEMTGTDNITLNANLVFGDAPAYVTYRGDKTGSLKGTVSGSAGITFQSMAQIDEKTAGITVEATGSYTGPTYVNSRLFIGTESFLPHGERLGDVHVNGILQSAYQGTVVMNGLNGKGTLRFANSYTTTVTVGDNDADGDFTGAVERAGGTFNFTKIGAGTQRLAGHCTHNGSTTVSGGTLLVDGDFTASSVSVATNAVLAGAGGITNGVTVANGGALAPGSTDGLGAMTVGGTLAFENGATLRARIEPDACGTVDAATVTNAGTVDVELSTQSTSSAGFGACVLRSASAIPGTFRCATKGYRVELRNGDTELWALKNPTGTLLFVK